MILIAACWLPLLTGTMVAKPTVAEPTAAEIAATIEDGRGSVRSLRFEYETEVVWPPELESRMTNQVLDQQVRFAMKGDKRYASVDAILIGPDGERSRDLRTVTWDGEKTRISKPKAFTYQAEKSSYSERNVYTPLLFWPIAPEEVQWASDDPATTFFLPASLRVGTWQVGRESEPTSGVECLKLVSEDGKRRYWMDPQLNMAVRRFEMDDPVPPVTQWEWVCSDFVRLTPKFHAPKAAVSRTHYHAQAAGGADARSATITTTYAVQAISANDVADEVFDIRPVAGGMVFDRIAGRQYYVEEPNDWAMEESIAEADIQLEYREQQSWQGTIYLLVAVATAAIAVVVVVEVVRVRRRRAD